MYIHFLHKTYLILPYRIQEEVDSVIGEREEITWEDITKLEYITNVSYTDECSLHLLN